MHILLKKTTKNVTINVVSFKMYYLEEELPLYPTLDPVNYLSKMKRCKQNDTVSKLSKCYQI